MKVIFRRTLEETLRIVPVILSVIAGLLGGFILARNNVFQGNPPGFSYFLNACLVRQHVVVFFLINGAVLMAVISFTATGLIANEVHEGTLRLLVAKPNSRMTILMAKVLGMLTGVAIMLVLSLCTMFAMEILMGKFDGNIAAGLLGYLPAYLLYGAIVTLIFSSLAVLLSCVARRKIIALLPMLLIMIMILGLPVILRVMGIMSSLPAAVQKIVDLNYHFGLIFSKCCDLCGGITGTSNQLETFSLLTNVFTSKLIDNDLTRTLDGAAITKPNNLLSSAGVLTVYLVLSCVNYLGSFLIIRRKNV